MLLVIRLQYLYERGLSIIGFSNPPFAGRYAYGKEHMFFNIEDLVKCEGEQV